MLQHINEFAESLRRVPETQRAAEYFYTYRSMLENDWRSSLELRSAGDGIPLPPPRDQGIHPRGSTVKEAFISFLFRAPRNGELLPEQADFQVCIKGLLTINNAMTVALEDHWRFDTHLYSFKEEKGGANRPSEPHPYLHFQRGGRAQDEFAGEPGFVPGPALQQQELTNDPCGLMQSPGPRIPVLPMCPILAVDFTISQNDGRVWQRLRTQPEYRRTVQNAQKRLWEPFLEALAYDSAVRRQWFGGLMISG